MSYILKLQNANEKDEIENFGSGYKMIKSYFHHIWHDIEANGKIKLKN
jgi:hypothetical protein